VEPTVGSITVGGVPAHVAARADRAARVGYVPQDPMLVPGESVAWHCRLHEPEPASDAAIDAALARVGLLPALTSRARARGIHPRDVAAGELSGGERRRMALARAILRPRELYVLDEPEAALDLEARALLAALLQELARTARVVLIVHDRAAIPADFAVIPLSGAVADGPASGASPVAVESSP
jgi:ATP-binding cassette subfamily C protein CydD